MSKYSKSRGHSRPFAAICGRAAICGYLRLLGAFPHSVFGAMDDAEESAAFAREVNEIDQQSRDVHRHKDKARRKQQDWVVN